MFDGPALPEEQENNMRALIADGMVVEVTEVFVICNYIDDDKKGVSIGVKLVVTERDLLNMQIEGCTESMMYECENRTFYYDMDLIDYESAWTDANERVDCALENGYIILNDLMDSWYVKVE